MSTKEHRPWPVPATISWILVGLFLSFLCTPAGVSFAFPTFGYAIFETYLLLVTVVIFKMILSRRKGESVTWDPFIYHTLLVCWPLVAVFVINEVHQFLRRG